MKTLNLIDDVAVAGAVNVGAIGSGDKIAADGAPMIDPPIGDPILTATAPRKAAGPNTFAWIAGVGVGLGALCGVAYLGVSQLTKPHALMATTAASPAVARAMAMPHVAPALADPARVAERPARSSGAARNERREAARADDQPGDAEKTGVDASAKVLLPPVVAQSPLPTEAASPSPSVARSVTSPPAAPLAETP